jgi:hypothetical protein
MIDSPYIVDVFSEIVTSVQSDSDKPAALASDAPYFMHGHPLDIVKLLKQKDDNDTLKLKKFPFIVLFQDFEERRGEDQSTLAAVDNLTVIIATDTQSDIFADERYDLTFRETLYPLYDLFVKHIWRSGYFKNVGPGLVPHTKIDRLYWGRQGLYGNQGNVFNDYIDAIEITDLRLEFRIKKC